MTAKKKAAASAKKPLRLVLPATSANLGPAFDAAALAFQLYLKVHARPATDFSIVARGRDMRIGAEIENHLIVDTYRQVLQSEGKPVSPLSLDINNEIPIGKGCGSSAAARLAGIALAVHFGDLRWTDSRIVGEASRREHHPDNAAACWMGGCAIGRMCNDSEAQVLSLKLKWNWPLLVAVPEETLPTEQSRRVLPEQYSRADAVLNVQNAMLLLGALVQGRSELLAFALEDRLHQPYRASLCPLLPALRNLAGSDGILGAVLSGAGPSVLIFCDPKTSERKIRETVGLHLRKGHLSAELLFTKIAREGARDGKDWKSRRN